MHQELVTQKDVLAGIRSLVLHNDTLARNSVLDQIFSHRFPLGAWLVVTFTARRDDHRVKSSVAIGTPLADATV